MSELISYFSQFVSRIHPTQVILMIVFAALLIGASLFAQSFRKRQYDIMGMRKYFFSFSGILIAICLASLIINGFHILPNTKLNFSLEFTGGTILELGFEDPNINSDKIYQAIEEYNKTIEPTKLKPPLVQMVGNLRSIEYPNLYREVSITIRKTDGSEIQSDELKGILTLIIESFGKTILIEKNINPGKEVTLKLGFSKLDIGKPQPEAGPLLGGTLKTDKADKERMQAALSVYDKKLELIDMTIAPKKDEKDKGITTINVAPMQYKVAILRISKEDNSNLSSDDVLGLMAHFSKKYGTIYKFKTESIGPVIGGELKQKAIIAIVIALCLQLIYITLRFGNQIRYGLAADIALFHDLIIMTGLYSIVGRTFDSPFIAAILTVIGYSVMDSIVIFDRIRENLKILKKETYEQAVNISVNQTMTRSINTLLTVLLCLFALYFFGGETLKNFAFALLVGCTTGAYSSIFIASPIIILIDEWVKRKEQERVAARRAALAAANQAKYKKAEEKKQEIVFEKSKTEEASVEEPTEETKTEKVRKKAKSKQRRRYNKLIKKKK